MYDTTNGTLLTSGFTKAIFTGGFTLTGTSNIEVDGANISGSPSYNLSAQLTASDSASYDIDTQTLNNTGALPVTGGSLNTTSSHTLVIAFPATDTNQSVANGITFTATVAS